MEYTGVIVRQESQDAVIVKCLDRKLIGDEVIGPWTLALSKALESMSGRFLVVDLTDVFLLTSPAIRNLIVLRSVAEERNIIVALCGMNQNIWETFRITRLEILFPIGEDEQTVLTQLRTFS